MLPKILAILIIVLNVIVVPQNDEVYWMFRTDLGVRLLRALIWIALLGWGGFWG